MIFKALAVAAIAGVGVIAPAAAVHATPAKPAVHAATINCTDSHWIIDVALPGPNRAFAIVNNADETNGVNANGTGNYGFGFCYDTSNSLFSMRSDSVPGPNNWIDDGSGRLVADAGGAGPHETFHLTCIPGTHNEYIQYTFWSTAKGLYNGGSPYWMTNIAGNGDLINISGVC